LDRIIDGIRKFHEEVYPGQRRLFEKLSQGQSPRLLLITCSDSRIDPALITQSEPGEVFVIRNAGNLVPADGGEPGGEAATIEYAVRVLGVRHVVVCGHSHCGAMGALADPEAAKDLPNVGAWLRHARGALDRVATFDSVDDPALRVVAANVVQQIENLRTHPSVREAEEKGAIQLHGWIYRFERGEVVEVDPRGALRALSGEAMPIQLSA
jgi:carbonic anhydrase